MSECYKCGRELPAGQVECDPPCSGGDSFAQEKFAKAMERHARLQVPIDWDKVQTFEDLKEIAKAICPITVTRGTYMYHKLKRFLKEEPLND